MVISTLNPPMIYGPPLQKVASRDEVNTSSQAIYNLINGEPGREVPWNRLPLFVNVRDIALAHVRALEVEDVNKVKSQRVRALSLPAARPRLTTPLFIVSGLQRRFHLGGRTFFCPSPSPNPSRADAIIFAAIRPSPTSPPSART